MISQKNVLLIHRISLMILLCLMLMIPGCVKLPYSTNIKLGECSEVSNHFAFRCPPAGDSYRLILGLPPIAVKHRFTIPPKPHGVLFTGTATIYNGEKEIHTFKFDSKNMMRGNWLQKENLEAFILTSTSESLSSALDDWLEENKDYKIIITFTEIPPKEATLWLHYISTLPPKNR